MLSNSAHSLPRANALYARAVRGMVVIDASLVRVLATPRRPQRAVVHRRPGGEWHNLRTRPAVTDMNQRLKNWCTADETTLQRRGVVGPRATRTSVHGERDTVDGISTSRTQTDLYKTLWTKSPPRRSECSERRSSSQHTARRRLTLTIGTGRYGRAVIGESPVRHACPTNELSI